MQIGFTRQFQNREWSFANYLQKLTADAFVSPVLDSLLHGEIIISNMQTDFSLSASPE